MSKALEEQYERIETLLRIHRCETAALLHEIVDISAHVRILMKTAVTDPKVPIGMVDCPDVYLRFLDNRKQFLQKDLEDLEKLDPSRAARFQEIINERGNEFGYES